MMNISIVTIFKKDSFHFWASWVAITIIDNCEITTKCLMICFVSHPVTKGQMTVTKSDGLARILIIVKNGKQVVEVR